MNKLVQAKERTKRREIEIKNIEKDIKFVTINECDFDKQYDDINIKAAIDDITKEVETTFIEPRCFYYGGRVNAVVLLEECNPLTHEIKYYDFISLYPSVMKSEAYPLGKNLYIIITLSCITYKTLHKVNNVK
jgi:DNA polymerase type B, organellar and viral